jgi:hypothetical protein
MTAQHMLQAQPSPREVVAAEARDRIRDHLGRSARYNPTASLKSLTAQITHEYEDRFLIELVQNAYDAHPPGTTDGQVHIRLDESSDPPTLWVGNKGRPFTLANFDALTNVAQSSKPPGEGIGNKGVGFRSVLQVCDFPEIFSADPHDPGAAGFTGYCFGFARDDEIRQMVETGEEYVAIVTDFSRYLLPVPRVADDPLLSQFRAQGLVTVIKLPLTTSKALELVRAQLDRLLSPKPPVALFLERLTSITVDHIDGAGKHSEDVAGVSRLPEEIPVEGTGPTLRWIDTAGRRFFLASDQITAASIRGVIEEGIEAGEIDKSWSGWDADAEVSLAVDPDGSPDAAPTMYTYLPMHARSPVHAYLHAPFRTKLARLNLNEASRFNSYLMGRVAQLAASTIAALTSGRTAIPLPLRQRITVDLLSWDQQHVTMLSTALANGGSSIASTPLAPILGPRGGERWEVLRHVREWNRPELDILRADRLAEHAAILEPSLGVARISRLDQTLRSLFSIGLQPNDQEVADWVEQTAARLERASPERWNRFLSEVALVFQDRDPTALQGRAILLDDQRKIRSAGPWPAGQDSRSSPTVFTPPQATDDKASDDLVHVPPSLRRNLCFLHRDLRLRERGPRRERTPLADLLSRARLVEQFDLATVLQHLRRTLAGQVPDSTCLQALKWVYAQDSASRATATDLRSVGLRMPTARGWISAEQTVFSIGWDVPRAATLDALFKQAGDASTTLGVLRGSAVLPPAEWPFPIRDVSQLREFLSRCGVRDGLFPVARHARPAPTMQGIRFEPETIARRFELEPFDEWVAHAREIPAPPAHPYTDYTGDSMLWELPGQDNFSGLSERAKSTFALAILEAAQDWPTETMSYGWQRRSPGHANKPDPHAWPSPARTFLERGPWFPMADAGRREQHYFVPPREGWTFDESSDDTAPRFARLAPKQHRRVLTSAPALTRRLTENGGLSTWNSPGSARARLIELGALVRSGEVVGDPSSIRRAVREAWADLARQPGATLPNDLNVVVMRGLELGTVSPAAVDQPPLLFVIDQMGGLADRVLELSGAALLVADAVHGGSAATLLGAVPGLNVRRTSQVSALARLDGDAVAPRANVGTSLTDTFGAWITPLLLTILDLRSTGFERITDRVIHDARAKLQAIRVLTGRKVEVTVDGVAAIDVDRLGGSIHLDDSHHPLLIVTGVGLTVPSWNALNLLADDVAAVLRQPRFASEFRAAALGLQQIVGNWRQPTTAELAQVLRCSEEAIDGVRRDLQTSTAHLRHLLAPFLLLEGGREAAAGLDEMDAADREALSDLLSEAVGPERGALLLEAAEASESVDAVRRVLSTDLGALNDALQLLGRAPLHFADEHHEALITFLAQHRSELSSRLRARFAQRFAKRADITDYARARTFSAAQTDPDWLHAYEEPTTAQLWELLTRFLENLGDAPASGVALAPLDDVRALNSALLDQTIDPLVQTVLAWTSKNGVPAGEEWGDAAALRSALQASGCLDFEALDKHQLIGWLASLQLWPPTMPISDDLPTLGLSSADLDTGKVARARAQSERRRARVSLSFNGNEYDTSTDERRELLQAIEGTLDDAFLDTKPALSKLNFVEAIAPKLTGPRGGPSRPARYAATDPPPEITAAIGLVGELLAYRWLQRTYGAAVTPDSWVSGNRSHYLDGHEGDDTLGFDFQVALPRPLLQFEVKATMTDQFVFDISDRELAAATAARKGQYRILFIRSALTPGARELLVLPSPLEPESARSFEQLNQGLRLRFDPQR